MGADVAEGEGLARGASAAGEAGAVEAVVEVAELGLAQAEVVAVAGEEEARRRDEEIDLIDDLADVPHPPADPPSPVGEILVAFAVGA